MINELDISPRKQQLKEEYDRLQQEYSDLVTERDDLELEGPQLEALYMETVGQLQYDMLMLQGDVALLKKKRDMLQACINRGEKPDWPVIEIELKVTFGQMNEKMKEEEEKLNKAKEFIKQHIQEEEARSDEEKLEIKQIFKRMVHRLHPDLHPDQTEWEKNLFLKVQEAYFNRDLERLRQLELELDSGMSFTSVEKATIEEWEERVENLKTRIAALKEEIKLMTSRFPFTYRDKVYNQEWVAARKEELQVQIARLLEEKDRLEKIIEILKHQANGESDS